VIPLGLGPNDMVGIVEEPLFYPALMRRTFNRPPNPEAFLLNAGDKAMLARHRGSWNILYADGHSQARKLAQVFDWNDNEVLRHWSRDNQTHRVAP
jgi:prepilin-type processing-associated H-X9-DG protein